MNRQSRPYLRLALACGILLPTFMYASVDTAWVRRYDGPGHGDDWAARLEVDTAGNVYVTGPSASDTGSTQYLDFVTIKYYPNGDTAWVRREDFGGKDLPSGLGVDALGNVYVTGTNNDSRMVTVKYSPTGNRLWYEFFGSQGGASDLVLDSHGNVMVCGSSYRTSADAAVVKYRPNGDTVWARYYDWASYEDDLDALALASQDGISTAGWCSDGNPGGNMLTLAYDSTGSRLWAAYYDGPQHGAEWANAVAVDSAGNVVGTGQGDNGYGTPWDYLTVKYDSTGETLWARRYDGTANGDDRAQSVAVDGQGNCYVTGYAEYTDTGDDFATIAYRPDGSVAWLARYDGPAHSGDGAYAIAVDESRRVYVTGNSYTPQTKADCATVCYDSLGDTIWVRRYDSPSHWGEYTTALVLGPADAVCVAGVGYTASGFSSDMLTIKYVQNGGVAETRTSPCAVRPALVVEPSVFSTKTTVRFS